MLVQSRGSDSYLVETGGVAIVSINRLWVWHLKSSSEIHFPKAANKLTKQFSLYLKIMLQIDCLDHTHK